MTSKRADHVTPSISHKSPDNYKNDKCLHLVPLPFPHLNELIFTSTWLEATAL